MPSRSGFASGATLAQLQASVPLGFAAPTFSTVENQLLNPKYYEWNLEVQQTLGKYLMVSLNYVGNHGHDEINQNPLMNAYAAKGFQGVPTTAPDPRFGEVRELNSIGYSYYDGLVASVEVAPGPSVLRPVQFRLGPRARYLLQLLPGAFQCSQLRKRPESAQSPRA